LARSARPATIRRVPRPLAAPLLAAAVLAATCLARPALGQSASESAAATELFNAGRDLLARGDYAAACPKLAESARLDAKVGTFARLAECEENLGHLAAARADWDRALTLARDGHDPRVRVVASELARVEKRVPKLVLIVPTPYPEGMTIKLDRRVVAFDEIGVPLPVDPGDHAIDARVPGWTPWTSTVATRADGAVSAVRIQFVEAPAGRDGRADNARARRGTAPLPVQQPYRIGGLVTASAGVLVLGAGVAVGIAALDKNASSNRHGCDDLTNICEQPGLDERRDARSLGNASTWLFIGGTALIGAGVAMIVFGPRDYHARTARGALELAPMIGPTTGAALRSAW